MTFSIVGVDTEAEEAGVAVQSKFLAAGALVPWAAGRVGAVATQSFVEATFGPRGLELLRSGLGPQESLDRLLDQDDQRELRQVGIADASGRSASFTGSKCLPHAVSMTGPGYACQGNVLASPDVVPSMVDAFLSTPGALAERMIESLRAGQLAGGDARGQEAAAIVVVKPGGGYGGNHDRYIDLRVDHHPEPIEELSTLLELHRFYFGRPLDSDVIAADPALEQELARLLARAEPPRGGDDVWGALFDYMGWENLEERWLGRGKIDRRVLDHLRIQTEGDTR